MAITPATRLAELQIAILNNFSSCSASWSTYKLLPSLSNTVTSSAFQKAFPGALRAQTGQSRILFPQQVSFMLELRRLVVPTPFNLAKAEPTYSSQFIPW
jgi:hypothetical protein